MTRLGAVPSAGRIAKAVEHNHDLRRRLIAVIHADARRAGLTDDDRVALQVRLTGCRSCSDMTIEQLRRVAGDLRTAAARLAPAEAR